MVMRGAAENDGYNALTLGRRARLARRGADPRAVALPAPGAGALFAGLHVGDAGEARRHSGRYRRTVPRPLRSAPRAPRRIATASRRRSPRRIEEDLQKVESLDEDRILRRFVNAVTLGDAHQFLPARRRRPAVKAMIAIKFESGKIDDLPLPRPLFEIFVYSPRVEGVHLRFGKVARGGIRWSDRREDFRTEMLGLVKAQQVKNAVIVPVGAKGGFVPKQHAEGADPRAVPGGRRRRLQDLHLDAARHHRQHPSRRHDRCRPMRGAPRRRRSLSGGRRRQGHRDLLRHRQRDLDEHGFWLGDAFASGGSAGYDHKKMGITARGAWEAVKRHFREMDVDIQQDAFTVVGVGDMSGDVFGNGMLRAEHHAAGGGLRSSPHLHRPRSRPGGGVRRAPAAVRAAALELGGLRQETDLGGRRRLRALARRRSRSSPAAQELFGVGESRDAAGADEAPS